MTEEKWDFKVDIAAPGAVGPGEGDGLG